MRNVFLKCVLVFVTGYVQSLIRRVVNNVNVLVNNLILKYVEDDIVLSVNITSAECYTVDDVWERAFMDVTGKTANFGVVNTRNFSTLFKINF